VFENLAIRFSTKKRFLERIGKVAWPQEEGRRRLGRPRAITRFFPTATAATASAGRVYPRRACTCTTKLNKSAKGPAAFSLPADKINTARIWSYAPVGSIFIANYAL